MAKARAALAKSIAANGEERRVRRQARRSGAEETEEIESTPERTWYKQERTAASMSEVRRAG